MTPSTTFQWPPSPAGTVQPVRSFPLKSEVKPGGVSARGGGAAHGERHGEGEKGNTTKGSEHGKRLLVDRAA